MPRNIKCRFVCGEPINTKFKPECSKSGQVTICVEELEAIRLCDLEELEQQDAAELMNISRGTLQRILYRARKKIALGLVQGQEIVIDGGNYEIKPKCCGRANACTYCRFKLMEE